METRRLALIGTLMLAIAFALSPYGPKSGLVVFSAPVDLVAFSCGGETILQGADPYLAEPLRACEDSRYAAAGATSYRFVVTPAPLPPYALALFGLLSFVPFGVVALAWLALELACAGVVAFVASRVAGVQSPWFAVATVGAIVVPSAFIGQLAPVSIAALSLAAFALRGGRAWLAAALAGLGAIEPHLALPVMLATFAWSRGMRVPLLAVGCSLAAISLCFGGVARLREYLLVVLPAHARGEALEFTAQYSLGAVLHAFGVPASLALQLGSLSYGLTLVLGVVVAGLLARRYAEPALLGFVPMAFAVIGGPFVHIHQIAAALPLGLYLFAKSRAAQRRLMFAAIVLLAIPFSTFAEGPLQRLLPPLHTKAIDPEPALARVADPNALAEVEWDTWQGIVLARDRRTTLETFATKVPTWFALLAIASLALSRARESERYRAAVSAGSSSFGNSGSTSGRTSVPAARPPNASAASQPPPGASSNPN